MDPNHPAPEAQKPARTPPRTPALPHSCRCGARWSGSRTAHCPTCCRTFAGVGGFDRHRRGGKCLDPAELGMRPDPKRPYTAWSEPTEEDTRDA